MAQQTGNRPIRPGPPSTGPSATPSATSSAGPKTGAMNRADVTRTTPVEAIAGVLSLVWLVGVSVAFLGFGIGDSAQGRDSLSVMMMLLAIFLPIGLIWVAASVARTARVMREEASRLQQAITAMRYAEIERAQSEPARTSSPAIEQKLDALAKAQKQTEEALVTFTSRRDHGTRGRAGGGHDGTGYVSERDKPALPTPVSASIVPVDAAGQAALALGTPRDMIAAPISVEDFIRAANFPETSEDKDGFRALRLALEDREAAKLIRSAQDILTLLSQEGIYMDDLRPDRTRPDLWRKFAAGERGGSISALGAIRDRSCLALTSARMRADSVFRDTAHHFIRQFDRTLIDFESHATDEELARLSETRSARAFMLLGRVTGMFD